MSAYTPINLKVVRFELDFHQLAPETPRKSKKKKQIEILKPKSNGRRPVIPSPPAPAIKAPDKKDLQDLVEELLEELYSDHRDWTSTNGCQFSRGSVSGASFVSSQANYREQTDSIERSCLEVLDLQELRQQYADLQKRMRVAGDRLARCVRARDRFRRQQKRLCAAFTVVLRKISGESGARFGVAPAEGAGEGGYGEWLHAMRLVARLPAGVPQHFRKKLWLTLAERHLSSRGVDWPLAERACFRGTAQSDDTELGAQIIKDLHRTGCSLFCGTEGRENQAMLRRVLLAYARWNKEVGYCQGFNMLAAIILEVMEKSESDSLKVMIYLVEAVLPEGYFADDLRGLSADMAAFRDLLRLRLPRLAHHMDHLQKMSDGGGVEPPLPDVFTMQWFLTLYATWLPRDSLLRIWDLILLDGNEVLLLTALAIWDMLQERIFSARSADEFYCCMGGGAGIIWEAGEALVAKVVTFGTLPELPKLRTMHRYRVTPPAPPTAPPFYQPPLHSAMQSMTKRGLKLFYSEDEGDSSDDGNKMALVSVIPKRENRSGAGDKLSLDIGALKRQYARLRERQRQAHVILAAACARHAAVGVPTSPTSLTVNNLLLGKSAIVSSRGRRLGPPPGAIPPSRQSSTSHNKSDLHSRTHSTETISWKEENCRKTVSRRNSMKWKDIKKIKNTDKVRKASIDLDEIGDGVIVSEREANEMIASLRSRSLSESSSYSSPAASSTDTSLCDENEHASDSETELPCEIKDKKLNSDIQKDTFLSINKNKKVLRTPVEFKKDKFSPIHDNMKLSQTPSDFQQLALSPICMDTKVLQSPAEIEKDTYSPIYKDTKILHSPAEIHTDTLLPITTDTKIIRSPIIRESVFKNTIECSSPKSSESKPVKNISDYLDTAAGEPLRTYIDGFESKLLDSLTLGREPGMYNTTSPYKLVTSPYSNVAGSIRNQQIIDNLSIDRSPQNKADIFGQKEITSVPKFTDLSPIQLSPCNFGFLRKSPYEYDYEGNFRRPSTSKSHVTSRPPDIIDSLIMYPNFVPDIDLSEKNISDIDSPPRSPGAESILVSEDEPPIPLKIDKYFEHSPEFFGARVTDPNNADIPNRRSTKRNSRFPKKPDSLTLQGSHNEQFNKEDVSSRASSLPQSHSFTSSNISTPDEKLKKRTPTNTENNSDTIDNYPLSRKLHTPSDVEENESPKDFIVQSGRKNSETALQIIQENSKILSRILTKQNIFTPIADNTSDITKEVLGNVDDKKPWVYKSSEQKRTAEIKLVESPALKESTSDSLIGYIKRQYFNETTDKNDFAKARPLSIDDPFSFDIRNSTISDTQRKKIIKTPSTECLANKTDLYGWENKGFLAKYNHKSPVDNIVNELDYRRRTCDFSGNGEFMTIELKPTYSSDWTRHSFSGESKTTVSPPSTELKDTSTYDRKFTSDEYNYPLSSKYNDYVLSKASDICSKTVNQGPKVCENLAKTDNSQVSEFAHVVTSSISFTYEPSAEDDSPIGAKSNSSDTLCQITSLDQVSTPISPKIFPNKESSIPQKECTEKSDRTKLDTDDSCSAITSLIETDTLSSLSYPRSPSTGSYHPFPTRPSMRIPKELGVRLGMYPKDTISSPQK